MRNLLKYWSHLIEPQNPYNEQRPRGPHSQGSTHFVGIAADMSAPALSVLGVGTEREHWQGFGAEPSQSSQLNLPTVYNASSSQCEYCQAL